MAELIDGKALAAQVRTSVADGIRDFQQRVHRKPGLAVVLVGDDPASQIYVRSKDKAARDVGIEASTHQLPANTPEDELLDLVRELNADDGVDGILVQLPLPAPLRA